jgi:formate hydrogenlyase subunit 7
MLKQVLGILLMAFPGFSILASSHIYSCWSVYVVSTGCSACDREISAANNPIFDIERFGVQVVASPRFADVLLVTGPVPKAMHEPLRSCYKAMAHPKLVIACGTCAISGGVHAGGYAEANGVGAILPVDIFLPGCPPHPGI